MANGDIPELCLEVVPVSPEQKAILANLLELYSHDFSEFIDLEMGVDGRFGYRNLDLYWSDPHRWPNFIQIGGRLAGFVLLERIPREAGVMWDVAEFFVMRGFRRRGVGACAAHKIFTQLPGRWQVRVMRSNKPACQFWSRAVHAFAGKSVRLSYSSGCDREWMVFSFPSPAGD